MNVNVSKAEPLSGLRILTTEEIASICGGFSGYDIASGVEMIIGWFRNSAVDSPSPPTGNDRPPQVGRGCNVGGW